RGRVLGMEAGVEIEPRPVLQEHVGVPGSGDDLFEEIPRDVVGGQTALTVQGAGETVLVLETEDPPLHVDLRVAGAGFRGKKPLAGASGANRTSWTGRGPVESSSTRSAAGAEPRLECGGTCDAPWCDRAPQPRDRAR